jgi:heterodisulfide reductase subunit C
MVSSTLAALPTKEADLRSAFWDQVATFPDGYKIRNCIQCGSCTGSCPVAHAMDITPREIVALFRAGFLEDILRSRAIWICASCYACTVRCPQGIRVTDNLYALKRLATQKGIFPKGFPAHAMSEAFVGNIHRYGRNWELGLGVRYFLRTRPATLLSRRLQRFGLAMLRRKRFALRPSRIRRLHEVRAIVAKAQAMGGL